MYISFEKLPENSKLWIFQSSEKLDDAQINYILKSIKQFIDEWLSHNDKVYASSKIDYKQFLIIAATVPSSHPSGCSVDKLMKCIYKINNDLHINLLDRENAVFLKSASKNTFILPLKNIQSESSIHDCLVFDNTISTKKQLNNSWIIPVKNSWLRNYI